mgnify:CR=1 FL=1
MEYTLVRTFKSERATVRVYSPILTDEERARRYEQIKKAAISLLRGR